MPSPSRFDLRPGLTEPVLLLISRQAIESGNVGVIAQQLRLLTASREDTWRYRSQVCLVIDGYQDDAGALVGVAGFRTNLTGSPVTLDRLARLALVGVAEAEPQLHKIYCPELIRAIEISPRATFQVSAMRAMPASRSAIRSSISSSPTCRRNSGPLPSQGFTKRDRSGCAGSTKLS